MGGERANDPPTGTATGPAASYPGHWEADVVLRDGGTAHIRPIRPSDADRLTRFYARLSDETIYFRFFSLYRELSARDVARFTIVDHTDRVALIATVGEEMIGVVRYERISPTEAEAAFNIEDAHQGRGIGSIFLEHLAAAARERGISRFVADVLPSNRKMLRVFEEAGYVVSHELDDGVVRLAFDLEPTEDSRAVAYAREHRAEARSVERLLRPRSVAVVGPSRSEGSMGATVLANLVRDGFTGTVHAVNPHLAEVGGHTAYDSVRDIPGEVDLVVVAVPADQVDSVVADSAAKGVRGLVVLSGGFAETGEPGALDRQRRLVNRARGSGMRVVGPASLGILNTDPDIRLNASLSPQLPPAGRVGFFSQSAAMGIALLDQVSRREFGLSSFVSAGNRVDLSGNELMQFWQDDAATDAVLLYLESFGNPRKFSRIARRLARLKPVVVVKSGRFVNRPPVGHQVRQTRAPAAAVEALFRQAGVIRVDSLHELFDVGQLVAHQPLPAGPRVAVVGNSAALARLAIDACDEAGLAVATAAPPLPAAATPEDLSTALREAFASEDVDSVVAVFIPPLQTRDEVVAEALVEAAGSSGKTAVATFLGMRGVPEGLRSADGRNVLPSYATPEDAVGALAAVTAYSAWRAKPAGHTVQPSGLDVRAARALVADLLGSRDAVELDHGALTELLACYGVELWPLRPVPTRAEALAAAADLGYPVALKSLAPQLLHRSDLGGVRLDLENEAALDSAYATMAARLGPRSAGFFAVQAMAPTGVSCVIGCFEDPLLGPVVSFGVGGVATELLGDVAYAIPPLTDTDLSGLVRSVRAAPLLFGHRGIEPVDLAAIEDVTARLARLADDLPEVAELELNPVVAAVSGASVLTASGRLARPEIRSDRGPRALLPG